MSAIRGACKTVQKSLGSSTGFWQQEMICFTSMLKEVSGVSNTASNYYPALGIIPIISLATTKPSWAISNYSGVKTMNKLSASLCLAFWSVSAQAHEVTVDTPFTPEEEIAGIDTPPYELESLFSGPVGAQLARARCSQSMLVETAIGEWLAMDNDRRYRFVNCVALVLEGPSRLNRAIEAGHDLPEIPDAIVTAIGILADLYRPPYNLSAAEVVSGTLVVFGMALPVNHRSLMREIAK